MNPLTVFPRDERWSWNLLSSDIESPMGTLDGVATGHLEWSIFNKFRMSGSMVWKTNSPSTIPNWQQYRIQPVYTAITDQGILKWPMGIYLPAAPNHRYSDTGVEVGIELYDKLFILDSVKVTQTYTVAAGAVVTDAVSALITGATASGLKVSVVPSAGTLLTSMVWEVGTSILTIVNELLDTIYYSAVWADRYGVFQVSPHIPAAQRGIMWQFTQDNSSIYTPEWENEKDTFDVPNQIVLTSTSDGTTAPLISVASDYTSPTGYNARGYWFSVPTSNVTTTSQAALDGQAARMLAEAMDPQETVTINHPLLPLNLNEAVSFTNAKAGYSDTRMVMQTTSIDTVAGAMAKTRLLVVNS